MDAHTIEVLEYRKVIDLIARYATGDIGRQWVLSLKPLDSISEITFSQKLVSEVRFLFESGQEMPPVALGDLSGMIKKAYVPGAMLDECSLRQIGNLARACRITRDFLAKRKNEAPNVWTWASRIQDVSELERSIDNVIDEEANVIDKASPALRHIRQEKLRVSSRIKSTLAELLGSVSIKSYLQEEIVTIRNGRYVIPVRADSRSKVEGIVHDTSQTGATVFIEPLRTVELNNSLRALEIEEREEIARILRKLTSCVGKVADRLIENQGLLASIDGIVAMARFALEFKCSMPIVGESPVLRIRGGRHPILVEMERSGGLDAVVPLDVEVNRMGLVITGPNAGGKTVALKTIGLLVLLTGSGLHVPCSDGTEIGLFKAVYADIGDEQSIELSLSTFSSHVRNVKAILESADRHSLVLLDEIGAGTDPQEGAALARAIIECLISKGSTLIATTHHGDLKVFAHEHPELENASMEFDEKHLRPTYKLIQGLPGASHALEIAKRLGMPQDLLERARGYVGAERIRFEDLTRELASRMRLVHEEQAKIEARRQEMEMVISEYEKRVASLKSDEKQMRKQAFAEARGMVEEVRKMAARLLEELKREKPPLKQVKQIEATMKAESSRLAEAISQVEEKVERRRLQKPVIGTRAYVLPLGMDGTILSEPDSSGRVEVAVGDVRAQVNAEDLYDPESRVVEDGAGIDFEAKPVPIQIDVRGMTAEDAQEAVDRYLDAASLYGYDWVRIIHGKGRGILARKIHAMLSGHPAVESHRFGEVNEGGTGVTVVRLRKT